MTAAVPKSPSIALRAIGLTLLVSTVVTALSYGLPRDYAATGVGLTFMLATYWFALSKKGDAEVRASGLSLGGVLETTPIEPRRLASSTLRALLWALGAALIFFPPFVVGWLWWWKPSHAWNAAALPSLGQDVLGEIAVIALPEEAFFRGFLQSELDRAWAPRWKLLGAYVGPGLIVSSALFAVGHVATELRPDRLAVFFPSLLFGWMRARTGGIGSGVLFHAMCNLFAAYIAHSFGFGR
ncbi:MAG: CPBP family intramembrane metalloprotease [Polyangiaceae bacterium]|nr:CPBP family intramembrane metalloprotease [Myxococcales bacterium]MCB9590165.1 CPBP family intramembrane metalloprotease [Polyangiaceae bacterium]MCB9608044.1 CPBP family intramembrane metalloprotease [Polyangiaceae bacterium]